jgi:hypothetical protein
MGAKVKLLFRQNLSRQKFSPFLGFCQDGLEVTQANLNTC